MRGYRARKKHLPDAPHSDVTAEMQRRELAAMGDIEHWTLDTTAIEEVRAMTSTNCESLERIRQNTRGYSNYVL